MNYKLIAQNCEKALRELLEKAKLENRTFNDEETKKYESLEKEFENALKMVEIENKAADRAKSVSAPVTPPAKIEDVLVGNEREPGPFKNLSDQLLSIQNHTLTGSVDERLLKVQNASGGNTGVGADGGFLVQKDFAQGMLESIVANSPIIGLASRFSVSSNADRVSWTDVKETSVASSVWGGVIAYWASEAGTVTATKPQFEEREIKLQQLMAISYQTMNLAQDASFSSALWMRALEESITRELESSIISGNGVGKCVGLITSGSKIEVAKESGQVAATIVYANIIKMLARVKKPGRCVWIAHPDARVQLELLTLPAGTAGYPVYMPAGMGPDAVDRLRGIPVYYTDNCSAMGSVGDIILADMNDYALVTKGDINTEMSIHVQFLAAENTFRSIFRVNGAPMKNYAVTLKNSSNTRSGIVTIATR